MNHADKSVLEKIKDLEVKLQHKELEVQRYRLQIKEMNTRVESMIEQMSYELKMAHKVQEILSPIKLPLIGGFEFSSKFVPGARFGGDYFDIFEHEDKMKFGIIVASASGYAMSALLLSVLIKVSTQIEARKGLQPHQLISILSDEMKSSCSENDHASIFYGVVDKRDDTLNYCSVGYVDSYLQKQGVESLEYLESCNGPIGKESVKSLSTMKVSLQVGDRLILGTEGLAKSMNAQKQYWGSEGVREAIHSAPSRGVHELRNEILFQNSQFLGGQPPLRDQTAVVMEMKDKVVKLSMA